MAVVEIFLASFLKVLLNRLTDDFLNFARQGGIDKKLKKWKDILAAIGAVLHDAEEKQLTSEAVKLWLDDLKDLAYDVEDILDDFSTRMIHRKIKEQQYGATTSKVWGLVSKVEFSFIMNSKIKKITDRLRDISERKDKLGLNDIGTTSTNQKWQRPPSSCVLGAAPVVGRDSDKAKIVEFLSRDEPSTVNYHAVAIVGMPGVGKTTLAQFVFNDNNDEVLKQFNLKVWVSVSDQFDVERVTKAILESITSQPCDLKEFSKSQEILRNELASKKFLIVLDDIWNTCEYHLWDTLQSPFHDGAPGSKIVVTTRDAEVAKTIRAIEVHNLKYISDDDCWKVFEQHAFSSVNNGRRSPNFDLLREKIVVKCGGLPLAARTLGGLLGNCEETNEWEEILDNKLWSLSDNGNILPVLKLSYHYLPSNLKRCFAYCSILPNDYEFEEKQLILLWMAEDLIPKPAEESKEWEALGADYFRELASRSFFQTSSKNNSRYVMHDLVSDLARNVAGEFCFRLEDMIDSNMQSRCSSKVRHLSYISGSCDGVNKFKAFYEVKQVRTFLPLTLSDSYDWKKRYLTCKVTHDLLPKLPCLRVLSLNGYQLTELPNSIGELKHLRYLDFSHTLITTLPESISTLYNLQSLILENCSKLKALPTDMRNLIRLRHLNNKKSRSIEGMPAQLGQLTNLQTLCNFVVGRGNYSRIGEMEPLLHLRGALHISRLENVNNVEDVRMANFATKDGLDELLLQWSEGTEMDLEVLDALKPSRKLRVFAIRGYCGLKFSSWIGDSLFSNMVIVRLEGCKNIQQLPPLGQLPSLRELYVSRMSGVQIVGPEFYGEGSLPFPLLEILEFSHLRHWKHWLPCEQRKNGVFPCLKLLSIYSCQKLEGTLPENLDLLSKLAINECSQLVVSVANYKQLRELNINRCKWLVHGSAVEFDLLEAVNLSSISEFRLLQTEAFMNALVKVKDLKIIGCEELTSLWKNDDRLVQNLISLSHLVIQSNSHLDQLHHLTSLQELQICDCPSLVSFKDGDLPPSLKEIKIELCSSLTYFAVHRIPTSLRRIEIVNCSQLKSLEMSSTFAPLSRKDGLEYMSIKDCPSLTSLFDRRLPETLKHVTVTRCDTLKMITYRADNHMYLEELFILGCWSMWYIPQTLLHSLQVYSIWECGNCILGEQFPSTSSLRDLRIDCSNRSPPKGMHNLDSLQKLRIYCSEDFPYFVQECFPTNLVELDILNLKNYKTLLDGGLHRLRSLRVLSIRGGDPQVVSFPPKVMVLPKSLIKLTIEDFPNLIELNKGFQSLTSLESLRIWRCIKLASIPKEGLPLSLTQLNISWCPLLQENCEPSKGRYWSKILHIPFINMRDDP